MYKITSGGKTIELCDRPQYIHYFGDEASPCTEKGYEGWVGYKILEPDETELEANAVLAQGEIYSINNLLDDRPKAEIIEIDPKLSSLDAIAAIPGIEGVILDIETALCELDA